RRRFQERFLGKVQNRRPQRRQRGGGRDVRVSDQHGLRHVEHQIQSAIHEELQIHLRRSHTRDNPLHSNRFRSRTSSEVASFCRKVGKVNVVYFVRFRPPLLIINS